MGMLTTEPMICKKTGRPFPKHLQQAGENFEYLRAEWERVAPENEEGRDVPPPRLRTRAWLENHLCDGLITKPGDWIKLSEDQSWWGWVTGEMIGATGDWENLQKRMAGLIKKQIEKIESKMENQWKA